ncbi:protein MOR1-like isoform X2 [Cornus florida]|uniref:protein MOR1-like isoform X2 n=1 Tax=Cornus florida TaxID=4283 RepID=UPI0028A0AA62|nr:protein MOR1-like isoform X2 [Cornus florida]
MFFEDGLVCDSAINSSCLVKVSCVAAGLTDAILAVKDHKDLFHWLSRPLTGSSDFSDASHLLKPVASAMTDKSAEVCKVAKACIGEILRVCGPETLRWLQNSLVLPLENV